VPLEVGIDHHALRHERRAVPLVEREIRRGIADLVAEKGGIPFHLADMRPRVGIQHQLVGIETMALFRCVGPMHPIAIDLPRADIRHVSVPGLVPVLGQLDAVGFPAAVVEQANLHLGGVGGVEREVDTLAVKGGAARIRQALAHTGGKLQVGSVHMDR
jgi:hypothetical protein